MPVSFGVVQNVRQTHTANHKQRPRQHFPYLNLKSRWEYFYLRLEKRELLLSHSLQKNNPEAWLHFEEIVVPAQKSLSEWLRQLADLFPEPFLNLNRFGLDKASLEFQIALLLLKENDSVTLYRQNPHEYF
ncbi:hypothetical protein D3C85_1559700 [compost metagenome]